MLPCCRQQNFEYGQVIPEDFICFGFGTAICRPLSSVANLDKYAQLSKARNESNTLELLKQYHQTLEMERKNSTPSDFQVVVTCTYHV
ncbi:cysteine motif protein 6 [Diadegma fenestrale ichnovirus]|nr:cysteine motif protein 6 [Diadegma fenestrale ichnovirus]